MKKGWKTVPLGELGELKGGGTPSRKVPEYFEGDIPWITGADVTEFYVKNARSFITKKAIENSATSLLPAKTVLVVSRTGVGKVGITAMPLCVSQDLTGIICGEKVLPEYLARYLLANGAVLTTAVQGSTILGITRNYLKQVQIPVPPLAEQERIVGILDEAEALRQRRAQADRRIADFLPALFHEMFGDPASNPKHWPVDRLGSHTRICTGKLDVNEGNEDGAYPFFTCGEKIYRINEYAFDTEAVLLAGNGDFGLKYYKGKFNAYQRTYVIEPEGIDGVFLYGFMQEAIRRIVLNQRGSAVRYLRLGDLTECPLILPSLSFQRVFAARVAEVRAMEVAQAQSRERLAALFASLLDRAFRGEL